MIDVHTHVYPQTYLALLRSRTTVPFLLDIPPGPNGIPSPPRLIILPSDNDPSVPPARRGRPIDSTYTSINNKLSFMDKHDINLSIISLANPWLDFLPANESSEWARKINDDVSTMCHGTGERILAFATLPLTGSIADVVNEIRRVKGLEVFKGVIMGTGGLGQGLDDSRMDEIWRVLEETETVIFLHPHYGLPKEVFGPNASHYGHVLPLALGFPMETTIGFTRMYLSGVYDRFPRLKILIAHAGGAVPFLGGRIESCVQHERYFHDPITGTLGKPQRGLAEILRTNVWLDAVTYSTPGVKSAVDVVGVDRVMFGTDHPFFPPLDKTVMQKWDSVSTNVQAIRGAYPKDERSYNKIVSLNAHDLFKPNRVR